MPRGSILEEKRINKNGKNGKEAGAPGEKHRVGIIICRVFWYIQFLDKNMWNFLLFFFECNFFYECSPYPKEASIIKASMPCFAAHT